MAITARQSPQLIIFGTVTGNRRVEWEGEYRGDRLTIDTEGGPLQVMWRADDANQRVEIGKPVGALVEVFEGQNGASLTFVRHINGGDLEHIGKTLLGSKQAA